MTKIMTTKKAALTLLSGVLALSSCNSFLDTMPDQRMELNDNLKIRELLVSAYPNIHHMGMLESRTDNVGDNGKKHGDGDLIDQESYRWIDLTGVAFDSSKWMWDRHYSSINTANQALAAIDALADPNRARAERGEALVVRAWCHFNLVNYFAQAYNSVTSGSDLGVPYIKEAETRIGVLYPRLTVKQVYEMIDKDLQEGLPLIDDRIYKAGADKYHFNSRAAAAFAAQFYLYYEKWDLAKRYATEALGTDPALGLRNLKPYASLTTNKEVTLAYVTVREPANLMLLNSNSLYGRRYKNLRFSHTTAIANRETVFAGFPGGSLKDFEPISKSYTAYRDELVFISKYEEGSEVTDKRNGTGIPYVIAMPFTVDKTLLVRAEANNMLKLYDDAAADLSLYYVSKGASAVSAQTISDFYNVPENYATLPPAQANKYKAMLAGVCKPIAPHFGLETGMQYNIAQAVLHARRVETLWEGDRWFDIKRYRISITHSIPNEDPVTLGADDLRKAMQIPAANVSAGVVPNPR